MREGRKPELRIFLLFYFVLHGDVVLQLVDSFNFLRDITCCSFDLSNPHTTYGLNSRFHTPFKNLKITFPHRNSDLHSTERRGSTGLRAFRRAAHSVGLPQKTAPHYHLTT
jgi:hypothetical protein